MSTGTVALPDRREPRQVVESGRGQEVALPAAQPGCPKLSAALAAARDRCGRAAKDGYNDFHKYKYASADEVINIAKAALDATGLAIIPKSQKLRILGDGNAAVHVLDRLLFLSHSSGEFVPIEIEGWPVIPERGRPLDKAMAVALTCSLAYWLRDLLQMPRGDEADMNTRDDRDKDPPRAQPKAEPSQPDPKPARPMLFRELTAGVKELAGFRGLSAVEMGAKILTEINRRFAVERAASGDCTDGELQWAADTVQKALAAERKRAADQPATAAAHPPGEEREPGVDEDEPEDDGPVPEEHGEPVGQQPAPSHPVGKLPPEVVKPFIDYLHAHGTTWERVRTETLGMIGRRLLTDAHPSALRLEELDRIKETIRKRQQPARQPEAVA